MDTYLIIIIVVIIFIAYKLSQLVAFYAQSQKLAEVEKVKKQKCSSTLNPLFSEEEVARKKEIFESWQKYVGHYFNELCKKEKEEVEAHYKSGKDKTSFKPSDNLLNIILNEALTLIGRNNGMKDYQKMIEANIAILNGKSIKEIEKSYWDQKCKIPYDNLSIAGEANIWADEKELKEMYQANLKQRKDFWQSSWNYILEKDYVNEESKQEENL